MMGNDDIATATATTTATTTTKRTLPPPNLSRDQIDRLLKAVTTAGDGSPSLPSTNAKLAGREVLIPAFGGVAFYEGELRPETKAKQCGGGGGAEGGGVDEIVYVSTKSAASETKAKPRAATRSAPKPTEDDVVPVSLSDAVEWLRQNSSAPPGTLANNNNGKKAEAKPSTTTKPNPVATTKAPQTAIRKPTAAAKHDYGYNDAPGGPMFNINEEYDANGRRIVGEAVNLSSRLKAVYGDDDPDKFNKNSNNNARQSEEHPGDESKTEAEDAPFDPTIGEGTASVAADATTKMARISDDEFDRISRRLEELALLEEQEEERTRRGERRPAKPLGGGPVPAVRVASAKKNNQKKKASSSSFGFKKGFLNNSTSKKEPKAVSAEATPSGTAKKKAGPGTKAAGGGVTIDVSQNKIREIPREGRQQPVPQRKPQQQQPQQNHRHDHDSPSRMLDSSVFSGQVSERQNSEPLPPQTQTPGVISADTAARVAANEQTQSLQHELEQQQQQQRNQTKKKKRVSRFKQQRQQELQQHPPY